MGDSFVGACECWINTSCQRLREVDDLIMHVPRFVIAVHRIAGRLPCDSKTVLDIGIEF